MAIGVAAQFDFACGRRTLSGRGGACGQKWAGYFTWENIPGWRWRMRTSKSKYRTAAEFDLSLYAFCSRCLRPCRTTSATAPSSKASMACRSASAAIANGFGRSLAPPGIPDAVWSMDSRAGGATEAEEAGVPIEDIRDALTHSESRTTVRYIRRRAKKIAEVAEARARKRAAESDGTA